MQSAEYYAHLHKADEYARKAKVEPDPQTRRALEAVSREYLRRAAEVATEKQTI
jgi:hypothetical protein